MPTPETSLETSSNMSLEDIGLVLATSMVCGSAFQFFKGIYNSPKGQRLIRGTQAVRRNGLRSGGINVAWVCLSHVMECSIDHVRQKEDPWNHIFSSAAAAGLLQMRKGLGPASRWFLFGGVFGALVCYLPIPDN
ncbi:Mitochondrial import inner membrane translocase subunit TIM17-2 [Forsythia ovata]|uniref:Mitochondrial import inner membrane translocase subunit TIM17-2 n=1 Tax=Forsythia ovata TaxID=205694 RepID=A0ABD1VGW2_9LAMI